MSGSSAREKAQELLSHALEQLPPGVLHPLDDETILYELLTDQLAPADRTRLNEHLLHCSACRKQVELLCELEGLKYALPAQTQPGAARAPASGTFLRGNRLMFAAAAAGLLLVVGLKMSFPGKDPKGLAGGVTVAQQQAQKVGTAENQATFTAEEPATGPVSSDAAGTSPVRFLILVSLADFGLSPRDVSRNVGVTSAEQQQRLSEKIATLREQLKKQPRSSRIQLDLAAELLLAGEDIEAIELIREVLRMQPDDSLALNALGIAQASRGNYQDALQSFMKALQDKNLVVPASINAADMLIHLKKFTEASELLRPLVANPELNASDKQNIQNVLDFLRRP